MHLASEDRLRDTRVVVCPDDGTPEVLQLRVFSSPCLVDRQQDPAGVECSRFDGPPTECSKGCVGAPM